MKKIIFLIILCAIVYAIYHFAFQNSEQKIPNTVAVQTVSNDENIVQKMPNTNPFSAETNPYKQAYNMSCKKELKASLMIVAVSFLVSAGIVHASSNTSVAQKFNFPITELGKCKSEAECKIYCDNQDNILACVDFAEKNGMMSAEEVARAKEFSDVLQGKGPGSCKDKKTCEAYCDGTDHMDECLSFAEAHNMISKDELEQAKKVMIALKSGAKLPGRCKDKNSCDAYCKDMGHIDECISFASVAGFMTPEEAEQAKKIMPFLKSGETPGKCATKDDCLSYCDDEGHAEECFNFAKKANMIPADKLKEMEEGMSKLEEALKQMPESVRICVTDKLGSDYVIKLQSRKIGQAEITEYVTECMKNFKPDISSMTKDIPGADYRPGNAPSESVAPTVPVADNEQMCAGFKLAPSCDYVPANVRDFCIKCKSK
jgi:hypothetical protein